MVKSAGLLFYKNGKNGIEVLLTHPGGPFWAKKDDGVWSIPKGEPNDGEDMKTAAKREFEEELGFPPPVAREWLELKPQKITSGKTAYIWALQGEPDISKFNSCTIEIDWPPKSGKKLEIPENDRAEWFPISDSKWKLFKSQVGFVVELADKLGVTMEDRKIKESEAEDISQISLF